MNELAHRQANDLATQRNETDLAPAVQQLTAWAESAHAAHEVATSLVQTSFVPQAFRGKAAEATAAILSGLEIGLSPMAALRSFDIIQGTAAARAATLRAVVQSKGHRMWLHEATSTRAIVRGQRRGEDEIQESVWTMDRAKQLGLTGKDNWRKQPQAMLVARATSECARLVASDAILGIAYSYEELADEGWSSPESAESAPKRTAKRTAQRVPVEPPEPDPSPEPDLDEPETVQRDGKVGDGEPANDTIPDEESAPEDEPDGVTAAQIKKLGVLFREAGMTERANALAYVGDTIGRQVASRNELTKDEASRVIDALERDVRPDAEPELPDANDGNDPWAKGGAE